MAPSEVFRILQSLRVIGSHIQHHRQCSFRSDAADQCIEREFANRNSESPGSLIADAQNALAVSHDNYINILIRAISEQVRNGVAHGIRNEYSTRPSIDIDRKSV